MICIEGHRKDGNKEICKCEGHKKVIVHVSKFSVEDDPEDNQAVVYDGHKYDDDQCEALQQQEKYS